MKFKYIIIGILISAVSLQGCNDKLDINIDPNAPSEVGEDLILPAVLSNFSYEVIGGWPVRTSSLWTKHLARAVPGPHEGHYRLTANDANNFWTSFSYIDVMQNCKVLIAQATTNENYNYSAIAKILLAWNMSMVTDFYGDAPFSDAFNGVEGVIKPTYDTQEEIYNQIQVLLDEAIDEAGRGVGLVPGADDFVYGGAMDSWQHLARTLKARFYLRLSNAPGYDAATQADLALQALNAGAITAEEIPTYAYVNSPGAENPWYQFAIDGKWDDRDRPSLYYVNMLLDTDDPRIEYQVSKVPEGDNAGMYLGVTNNSAPTAVANYSAIHSFYSAADASLYWLVYAEVPFIRAEAEFLKAGKTVTGAVTEAYEAGVAASMDFYGISDYADYLAANGLSANADEAYEQIMTQKYIANYLQFESYNDFRRTGYPELPINEELYPGSTTLEIAPELDIIPLRLPYPSSERQYNPANIPSDIPAGYQQAMVIPVWWDNE
ncbi:SusD/RagB family nutrient-binding outer membrane lipoprotein [Parapedobacter sp. 10938]|uniref:SusD/RagB family nutrient-binding outer membrane lipoprotein n=1 Tax=Parapedobacter flavus TaxID=3110225 RepID=UPI002DBDAB7F|nr:SusD/RagB family nutrient-binding outer membrane lipoprotein [Parapedobacter sp. 10938]MEC3878765.1 SusD/RagB family nutrient-binding outer membrane lipoprotein [Parapedobacter sp. 10938]